MSISCPKPEVVRSAVTFDNLSEQATRVFKNLRGEGKLTAANMEAALREIRVALLEADVNVKFARQGGRGAEVRIALGSVAATVVRCYQTEQSLRDDPENIGAARAALSREIAPIDDIGSSALYRLRVAANLLGDLLCR